MTTKGRDSNMDMMRISAMLFVMVYHINYFNIALEEGAVTDYSTYQILGFSLMKCVSMVCVNMFILISGWYGIKPKFKTLCKLIFQIWFFSIPTYLCLCFLYEDVAFSLYILFHLFILEGYWFIPAYFLLYICSPVLNSFVNKASQKTFLHVLIAYLVFMFLYGWIERKPYFNQGCSPLVFFVLYLIARYLRFYPNRLLSIKVKWLVLSYLLILLITSILCTLITTNFSPRFSELLMQNSSPFNIGLSILLLLTFTKIKIRSSFVNKIGISCFSAYLLHGSPLFYEKIYYPLGIYSFGLNSIWMQMLFVIGFITAIFTVAILLDQIRILLWKNIELMITPIWSKS